MSANLFVKKWCVESVRREILVFFHKKKQRLSSWFWNECSDSFDQSADTRVRHSDASDHGHPNEIYQMADFSHHLSRFLNNTVSDIVDFAQNENRFQQNTGIVGAS